MNRLLAGALAGFVATIPMTAAMVAMHRRLPRRERYPLPPREITDVLMDEAVGPDDRPREEGMRALTLAAHFGYGAAAGSLFGPIAPVTPVRAAAAGVAYGLAVWTGSYLGLLPVLGILVPATEHPPRRNALMIAAHVAWGATLGAAVGALPRDSSDAS